MIFQQHFTCECVKTVFAKVYPVLIFTVSTHQAIEILDQTEMVVTLFGNVEEIYMFLSFSVCYSEWIYPVLRIVSKYIHGNPILSLKFRYIL